MTSAEALPDDIETLKELVLEKENIVREQAKTIAVMEAKLSWSEEKLRAWELRYYGRKSEKFSPSDEKQNRLFDEAEANADETGLRVTEKIIVPSHERKKKGRKPKVDTLPVREIVHELNTAERSCPCCGKERPEIGEELTSEYDLVPAHLVKIVHIRKKYGPCVCAGFERSGIKSVIAAEGPAKIVKGSDFTNRTIAFFLTGKYADAIPFYRMTKLLDRAGLVVSRATLCNLAASIGRSLGDIIEIMNRDIARSPVMLMDETTVQVLKNGESPPKKSYMWVAVGYREGKPIKRFAYHGGREGEFADKLLEGFSGYLQTDGYSGYTHLNGAQGITRVGCFAHIRRRFVEAWEVVGKQGPAKEVIDIIAGIYHIENDLRKKWETKIIDEGTFLSDRKRELGKEFEKLRAWLMTKALEVTPQSKLGQAIAYAQSQFDAAIKFIEHPLLRPDTNLVENAIRPFVIGRKNWLFSGSPRGAHTSAGIYSLIETAKSNGHEPFAYLCHLFDQLPKCNTIEEREKLLPYRIDPTSYNVDVE
jgi:transposase